MPSLIFHLSLLYLKHPILVQLMWEVDLVIRRSALFRKKCPLNKRCCSKKQSHPKNISDVEQKQSGRKEWEPSREGFSADCRFGAEQALELRLGAAPPRNCRTALFRYLPCSLLTATATVCCIFFRFEFCLVRIISSTRSLYCDDAIL